MHWGDSGRETFEQVIGWLCGTHIEDRGSVAAAVRQAVTGTPHHRHVQILSLFYRRAVGVQHQYSESRLSFSFCPYKTVLRGAALKIPRCGEVTAQGLLAAVWDPTRTPGLRRCCFTCQRPQESFPRSPARLIIPELYIL